MQVQNTQNENKTISSNFIFILITIGFLLLIDFIPQINTIDAAGYHWFVIGFVNLFLGYSLLKSNKTTNEKKTQFGIVSLLYFSFIILSGFSIITADNKIEAFITFNRMFTIANTVLLFKIFSQKEGNIFISIATLISIVVFIQNILNFNTLLSGINKSNPSDIVNAIKWNYGNVNIRAAASILKIPFVLFCIFYYKGIKKYFFIFTLFLSSFFIVLTFSRANILSLLLILFLLTISVFIKKLNLKDLGLIALCVVFSFLTAKHYSKYVDPSAFTDQLLGGNTDPNDISNGRFTLWSNTFELIKNKPITGHGLGNYKIATIPQEGPQRTDWRISKYSHNDFLQTFAESGILTGLIYLAIFVIPFLILTKNLFKEKNKDSIWETLTPLMLIIAIGFDSSLNFPLHRPSTQVMFVLFLFIYFNFNEKKEKQYLTINTKYLLLVFVCLGVLNLYPHYKHIESLKAQNTILTDEKVLKLSYNEINNSVDNFPNLTELGYPINYVKARYLQKENKTTEALKLCYKSLKNKENNEMMTNQSIIASIYTTLNKPDSAIKYWKICTKNYPFHEPFYANYLAQLAKKKDTTAMVSFINKNLKLKYPPKFLFVASKYLLDAQYPIKSLNKLLIKDIEKNSNDSLVNVIKNVIKQNSSTSGFTNTDTSTKTEVILLNKLKKINPENWKGLITIYKELDSANPKNYIYAENIGVSYFRLNQYKKAIPYLEKVIQSRTFKNGKSEYIIAACYHYLKNKNKACQYAQQALNYGYKDAKEIINKNCN